MFPARVLRLFFGCYAFLVFLLLLFIATPVYLIVFLIAPDKQAAHIAHKISRAWAFLLSVFFFQPYRVRNKSFIDPNKTYVFVANHRSQLDIPLFARACKNTFRFLAKAELKKIPLLGYVIGRLYVTVNRSDRMNRTRSIELLKQSLEQNISVFLCPEGTRNRNEDPP
ncbi:MAG TPA: lysophospholipid acyltransferase family protein, partial [Bacteroidia bacterium]|nr:lysophospholipid acyltransferase family protein [Bacteroidia bacterium]